MRASYTFHSIFGAKTTWKPAPTDIAIDRSGIVWKVPPAAPPEPVQVQLCREYLREARRTIHPAVSSYSLKHRIEKSINRYISNGALIEAAKQEGIGFAVRPGSPNAMLCLSTRILTRR